ncbi:hypothetical protein [Streptomyces sp. NPDC059169]
MEPTRHRGAAVAARDMGIRPGLAETPRTAAHSVAICSASPPPHP